MPSRRALLKGLLGITLAGLFAAIWGLRIEPGWRLRVQRWQVKSPIWGPNQPLKIVMIADLHAGVPNMGPQRVAQIVDLANAQGGDLILLMGDYRATHPWQSRDVRIEEIAPTLARLKAPLGVHAILGNHDWRDDHAAFARRTGPVHAMTVLEQAGIPVLQNRGIRIQTETGAFWLLGLDSQAGFTTKYVPDVKGPDDLPGTLAQITDDAPAILLAHEPDIFPQVPDRIALTLSGHTHRGQVRFFGWAPVVPSAYGSRYLYGPVTENGRTIVISGGLGCSGFPVRFDSPPEITVVDLSA